MEHEGRRKEKKKRKITKCVKTISVYSRRRIPWRDLCKVHGKAVTWWEQHSAKQQTTDNKMVDAFLIVPRYHCRFGWQNKEITILTFHTPRDSGLHVDLRHNRRILPHWRLYKSVCTVSPMSCPIGWTVYNRLYYGRQTCPQCYLGIFLIRFLQKTNIIVLFYMSDFLTYLLSLNN